MYVSHLCTTHSSVDEHLGCFHVLTITNIVAMNITVYVSFWIMAFIYSFFLLLKFIFNWRIIALQCSVHFCYSNRNQLPPIHPHPTPLGCHRAPSWIMVFRKANFHALQQTCWIRNSGVGIFSRWLQYAVKFENHWSKSVISS